MRLGDRLAYQQSQRIGDDYTRTRDRTNVASDGNRDDELLKQVISPRFDVVAKTVEMEASVNKG